MSEVEPMRGSRAPRRSCAIHGDNGCENQGEAGRRTRADDNRQADRDITLDGAAYDEQPVGECGCGHRGENHEPAGGGKCDLCGCLEYSPVSDAARVDTDVGMTCCPQRNPTAATA